VPDALSRLLTPHEQGRPIDDDVPPYADHEQVLVTTRSAGKRSAPARTPPVTRETGGEPTVDRPVDPTGNLDAQVEGPAVVVDKEDGAPTPSRRTSSGTQKRHSTTSSTRSSTSSTQRGRTKMAGGTFSRRTSPCRLRAASCWTVNGMTASARPSSRDSRSRAIPRSTKAAMAFFDGGARTRRAPPRSSSRRRSACVSWIWCTGTSWPGTLDRRGCSTPHVLLVAHGGRYIRDGSQLRRVRKEPSEDEEEDEPAAPLPREVSARGPMYRHLRSPSEDETRTSLRPGDHRLVQQANRGDPAHAHRSARCRASVCRELGLQVRTPEDPHLRQWEAICKQILPASMFDARRVEHIHLHLPPADEGEGGAERYNRTVLAMLRNYVNEHQEDWDKYASSLTYA